MSYDPQGHAPQASTGNTFSTLAFVFGGISFLFLPIILGPVAVVMAIISKSKKESRSTPALVVAILGFVFGMIIGAIVGAAVL